MRLPSWTLALVATASLALAQPPPPATQPESGSAAPEAASRAPLFPILARGRWGFVDASGRVVIAPRYESTVAAESERQSAGPEKADELFMAPSVEPETTAIVAVRSGHKWGFVDRQDRLLPLRFDEVGEFSEGLAAVRQGELWGFVRAAGTIAVQPQFDLVGAFVGGVAIVGQESGYGVIDPEGRFVVRPRFESIRPADSVFQDNRALVTLYDKKGFVSRAGTIAVPVTYDQASPFSEGLAAVTRGGRTAYIDTTGHMVIAPRLWSAGRFSRGRAVVYVSGQGGYIDRTGAFVVQPQFTEARPFGPDDRALAWKGPAKGWVDLSGRWSPERIEELQPLDDSLVVAVVAHRTGLVRRATGQLIHEYPWEEIGAFAEGLAPVRGPQGLWGFTDLEGRVAIPLRFRLAGGFEHGLSKAATRDSLGWIDRGGAWVWATRFR